MKRNTKRYEILPGVPTPDIKTIVDAASDFSKTGVEDIDVKHRKMDEIIPESGPSMQPATGEQIEELKRLGAQVSEAEKKAMEESKKKMEAIKNRAVSAPESISELRKAAAEKMSEEQKEEFENNIAEQERLEAEEEAKKKAREERTQQQKKALEESKARKAAKEEELKKKVAEQDKAREAKEAAQKAVATEDTPTVSSDEETLDDFSEFL